MAFAIEWDTVGEREYQSGVDRGVMYLPSNSQFSLAIPWNGLVSVEENDNAELKSYYLDGVKILDHVVPGEFSGRLSAITYPPQLDFWHRGQGPGIELYDSIGFHFHDQPYHRPFDLSYRTKIGNDIDEEAGYIIHILYGLTAIPESRVFETQTNEGRMTTFGWTLSAVPVMTDVFGSLNGVRPTTHVSFDTRTMPQSYLDQLEDVLYNDGHCPSVNEIRAMFNFLGSLTITDNGDGTWTAAEEFSGGYIKMLDADTFEIRHADAEYCEGIGGAAAPDYSTDYYRITTTPGPLG